MYQSTGWPSTRSTPDTLPLPLGGLSNCCSSEPTAFDKLADKFVALAILKNDCCPVFSLYLYTKYLRYQETEMVDLIEIRWFFTLKGPTPHSPEPALIRLD